MPTKKPSRKDSWEDYEWKAFLSWCKKREASGFAWDGQGSHAHIEGFRSGLRFALRAASGKKGKP